MKLILSIIVSCLSFSLAQAEPIMSLRDWSAEKDVMTVLNKKGCVAETLMELNTPTGPENFVLQVVKMETGMGDYTPPMILVYPENKGLANYYEAKAQSNKAGTPVFAMTLLQPDRSDKSIVAARSGNRLEVVRRLKADSTFSVELMNENGTEFNPVFSLSGSSKTINAMDSACR